MNPASLRDALLQHSADPDAVLSRLRAKQRTRRRRRFALTGGLAALTLVAAGWWATPAQPDPNPFPQVASPPAGPVRAPGTLSATPGYGPGTRLSIRPAAQVLGAAAAQAARQPDVLPRGDQFFYVRSVNRDGLILNEAWHSIDGTRDGLIFNRESAGLVRSLLPGCRNGEYVSGTRQGDSCTPDPAYQPDLPTDSVAMARHLADANRQHTDDPAQNMTNGQAKTVMDLAGTHYLRPAQRAALYRAAARIPGVTVLEDAVDAAGRAGTGVAWTFSGHTNMWIFDEKEYAYLGMQSETTVQAVVDEVGRRP
ncbi:CU044_5270 family protein [Actinoplanes sp. DH11]|uniref:CU044_5270 family protein n=1 Tax=Actinoplanes sp. DH11 TaxID=2857011 RepID=UPI001E2994D3|nr:CU044_5270 family protein [Actinoplanes sp. DH11]